MDKHLSQQSSDVAIRIARYRLQGYSPRRIAELFDLPERTVRDVLAQRGLCGRFVSAAVGG